VWIRRLRLGYCILLKVERVGSGKVYGVGANNEVNSRLMVVQHLPYAVGSVYRYQPHRLRYLI